MDRHRRGALFFLSYQPHVLYDLLVSSRKFQVHFSYQPRALPCGARATYADEVLYGCLQGAAAGRALAELCESALTYTTQVGIGLDPEWEETTEFEIADPEVDKVEGTFFVKCEKNGNEQQLGDKQSYALGKLLKGKQTFKGLVVPGGKADMMFTALDFGNEEAEEEDDAFMDFL